MAVLKGVLNQKGCVVTSAQGSTNHTAGIACTWLTLQKGNWMRAMLKPEASHTVGRGDHLAGERCRLVVVEG